VLARRGLRSREWAVEWDESALEFLLREGFTPDLGARPLKRAVERHFLTPLALAIVEHDYPSGDQFLFVRARGAGLEVTFVDPDAPEPAVTHAAGRLSLRALAREGGWDPAAAEVLADALDAVRAEVEAPAWQSAKAELLERVQAPGFWEDPGRFTVLDGAEVRDRIEAGLRTALSLLERLRGFRGDRRPPADLVRRAAQRALLLSEAVAAVAAGEPADALLGVEGETEFAERLAGMYRAWARERGMRLEVLEADGNGMLAAVSGFAALQLLQPEAGLHVLEIPGADGARARRERVRVTVAADPPGPPGDRASAEAAAARAALAAAAAGRARIVRRYRDQPAPLVRDVARGWRTGRLDDVLAGGFDLMEP
jgi:ATP-dependent Clp protease ATP-binding subunit ClpC